jgi:hypothetical protein
LTGGNVGPVLLLVLIEASEESHVAIEGAKLHERDRALSRIDDAGIELAHHIEQTRSRLIEISSAHIARIGEQHSLVGAASRPYEREPKIVPGEERAGGDSSDRQACLIWREFDRGRLRRIAVAGRQKYEEDCQAPHRVRQNHLVAGTFGAAPIASSPA